MTDYTELANRIVGHGVGETTIADSGEKLYRYDDAEFSWSFDDRAEKFVKEGRVVLAMFEKCEECGIDWITALCKMSENAANEANESMAVAIHTACCAALDEDSHE